MNRRFDYIRGDLSVLAKLNNNKIKFASFFVFFIYVSVKNCRLIPFLDVSQWIFNFTVFVHFIYELFDLKAVLLIVRADIHNKSTNSILVLDWNCLDHDRS